VENLTLRMDYINLHENRFLLEDFDSLFESLPDEIDPLGLNNFDSIFEEDLLTKNESPALSEDSGFQGIDPYLIMQVNQNEHNEAEVLNKENTILETKNRIQSIEREHSYSQSISSRSSLSSFDEIYKNDEDNEVIQVANDLDKECILDNFFPVLSNNVDSTMTENIDYSNNNNDIQLLEDDDGKFSYVNEKGVKVVVDKSRKNAEMARLNRRRKKRYVSNLEAETKSLRVRNKKLMEYKSKSQNQIHELQSEVAYLRSVINNDSMISSVLKSISNNPDVELKKQNLFKNKFTNMTSSISGKHGPSSENQREFNGGVCLHISNNKVGLEFCSSCNKEQSLE